MYQADDYGFYTYNYLYGQASQVKSYSKYDVMCHALPDQVKWNYNDEFFSSFDWTQEPVESLDQLYLKRAEDLRHQYDYLILMYSGGSDSGNILETFVQNKIHLDEVCHLINYQGTSSTNSFQNREIFEVALPKAEKYGLTCRLIDHTDAIIKFFNKTTKFDFIHWTHSHGAPNMHVKSQLYKTVKEWVQLIEAGKKIAIIWGCDKPRVVGNDGQFYFHFTDIIDGAISVKEQNTGFGEVVDELFYWAPKKECARLLIKQAHIIKGWMQYRRKLMGHLKYPPGTEITCSYNGSKLGGEVLKNLIYSSWDSADLRILKSSNGNFLSDRDQWFWSQTSDERVKLYLQGVEHVANTINHEWLQGEQVILNNRSYPKHIKKINSKLYALQSTVLRV